MIRDSVILVIVLLLLITIVSAFGGAVRHTPKMSPEGFYGLSSDSAESDESAPPPHATEKDDEARAAARAAMAAAGLQPNAEPPMPVMVTSGDDPSAESNAQDAAGNETFAQQKLSYAPW